MFEQFLKADRLFDAIKQTQAVCLHYGIFKFLSDSERKEING